MFQRKIATGSALIEILVATAIVASVFSVTATTFGNIVRSITRISETEAQLRQAQNIASRLRSGAATQLSDIYPEWRINVIENSKNDPDPTNLRVYQVRHISNSQFEFIVEIYIPPAI